MATSESLDEFFSTSPPTGPVKATTPSSKAEAGSESLDEFFSTPAPKKKTDLPPMPVGSEKERAKQFYSDLGRGATDAAASLGDMALSVPGMAAGAVSAIAMRLGLSLDKDVSRQSAAEATREYQDYVSENGSPTLFKNLVEFTLGPKADANDPSVVDKAMQSVSTKLEQFGTWVEKKTGGSLLKDEVVSDTNMALGLMGAKGTAAGLNAVSARLRAKAAARAAETLKAGKEDAENPDVKTPAVDTPASPNEARMRPEPPPKPATSRAKSQAKADVERSTGLSEMKEKDRARGRTRAKGELSDEEWESYLSETAKIEAKNASFGAADPKLLAAMAVGATGLALAAKYPDEVGENGMLALGLGIGARGVFEGETLGSILKKGTNSLTTLERLPQNRIEYPKAMVEEQLRRSDVTKAEKDLVTDVLTRWGDKETISAADLAKGVRIGTQDFELVKKDMEEFAGYGLDSIDRAPDFESGDMGSHIELAEERQAFLAEGGKFTPATTSIWKLPDHLELGSANHFNEPNYFGHTRSFEEGGVKHVVEIQSDLAQKAGQRLTGEQLEEFMGQERRYGEINAKLNGALYETTAWEAGKVEAEKIKTAWDKAVAAKEIEPSLFTEHDLTELELLKDDAVRGNKSALNAFRIILDNLNARAVIRIREATTKLQANKSIPADLDRIEPMLKHWDRRLIREELADSARQGEKTVRFATADTVAKVEGWPNEHLDQTENIKVRENRLKLLEQDVKNLEEIIHSGVVPKGSYYEAQKIASPELITPKWAREERESIVREIESEKISLDRARTHLPETPRFRPEHQSIYNRYAKETTKFLKGLGGKEVTDEHGHTWIETPTGIKADPIGDFSAKQAKMFGGATPEQLKNLALLSLGAAAGVKLDPENPIIAAFLGATSGFLLGHPAALAEAYKGFRGAKDERVRIKGVRQQYAHALGRARREAYQVGEKIIALLPDKDTRAALGVAVDEGKVAGLVGNAAAAAKLWKDYTDKYAALATKLKVINGARNDYLTHIWARKDLPKIAEWLEKNGAPPNVQTGSRFGKKRVFETLAEGRAAGFTPLITDPAELATIYGESMGRAVAGAQFVEMLKRAEKPIYDKGGKEIRTENLLQKESSAPSSYRVVDADALRGYRVHPDIYPSMKFLFEAQEPGAIWGGMLALNTAMKRNSLTGLFHTMALMQAGVGALGPIKTFGIAGKALVPKLFGQQRALKWLREGGLGDEVDNALRDELTFGFERSEPPTVEMGGQHSNFYSSIRDMQAWIDEKLPFNMASSNVKMAAAGAGIGYAMGDEDNKLSSTLKGAAYGLYYKNYLRINHAFDNLLWGRLHPALKLETYLAKKEELLLNNAKQGHAITDPQAGRIAARYSNDVFGGLAWGALAESAKSKTGRDIALSLAHPASLRNMGLLIFAPDWTLSTSRALYKTIAGGEGSGVKGLFKASAEKDLYRQQLVRSAFYYFAVGNALNKAISGHWIWENPENVGYFYIDFGDGRKMQLSKHFAEPFHWSPDVNLRDPKKPTIDFSNTSQQALNKLGIIPKEAATQLLGQQYLSARGKAPPMDTSVKGRLAHAGKNLVPIAAQQASETPEAGISGFLGMPIYGKTQKEKQAEAKQKRDLEHRRRIEAFKKANGLQ